MTDQKAAALYDAQLRAEDELVLAFLRVEHILEWHPEDKDAYNEAWDDLYDAREEFKFASLLLEAHEIESGDAEWSDGAEARAYLGALRVIAAHLEAATSGAPGTAESDDAAAISVARDEVLRQMDNLAESCRIGLDVGYARELLAEAVSAFTNAAVAGIGGSDSEQSSSLRVVP